MAERVGRLPTVSKYDQTSTWLAEPVLVLFSIFECGFYSFALTLNLIDSVPVFMNNQIGSGSLSCSIFRLIGFLNRS